MTIPRCFSALLGVLVVLAGGCGVAHPGLDAVARDHAARLEQLRTGMTEREVHERMGRGPLTYQVHPLDSDTLERPLRTERYGTDAEDTFTVLWYHADTGYVTPQATTPVILKNGRVVGRGQATLDRYRGRFPDE